MIIIMQAKVLQNKFKISLQKKENIQEELRSELNEILKGTPEKSQKALQWTGKIY